MRNDPQSGRGQGHVTYFLNFGTSDSITFKRMKLDPSFFCWIGHGEVLHTGRRMTPKGAWPRSRVVLLKQWDRYPCSTERISCYYYYWSRCTTMDSRASNPRHLDHKRRYNAEPRFSVSQPTCMGGHHDKAVSVCVYCTAINHSW